MKNLLTLSSLAVIISLSSGLALAADQQRDQDREKTQLQDKTQDKFKEQKQDRVRDQSQLKDQDKIYGSQLMTKQERAEHRAKMKAAKTVEDRKRITNEHHELMQMRAKARGITLPDQAPAKGAGSMKGQGGGNGPGGGGR
jgi:hypothetical protein